MLSHLGERDNKQSVQIVYSSQVTLTTYYFMEHLQIMFLDINQRYLLARTTGAPKRVLSTSCEHHRPPHDRVTTLKTVLRLIEKSLASTGGFWGNTPEFPVRPGTDTGNQRGCGALGSAAGHFPHPTQFTPRCKLLTIHSHTLNQQPLDFSLSKQHFSSFCSLLPCPLSLPLAQSTRLITHMHKILKKAEKPSF